MRFHRPLVGLHQPGREMLDLRHAAHRAEALEAVDQLVALVAAAHHHRRQLPVPLERFHHGALGFRHVQPVASVMLTDLFGLQFQQLVADPT